MTPRTVGELTDELVDTIRTHAFGLVAITGVLHGWKTFRSGIATGELVESGTGAKQLRIFALRHHPKSADAELSDIGWVDGDPQPVTVHGQLPPTTRSRARPRTRRPCRHTPPRRSTRMSLNRGVGS